MWKINCQGWEWGSDDIFKKSIFCNGRCHWDEHGMQLVRSVSACVRSVPQTVSVELWSLFLSSPIKSRLTHSIFGVRTSRLNSYITYISLLFFRLYSLRKTFPRDTCLGFRVESKVVDVILDTWSRFTNCFECFLSVCTKSDLLDLGYWKQAI